LGLSINRRALKSLILCGEPPACCRPAMNTTRTFLIALLFAAGLPVGGFVGRHSRPSEPRSPVPAETINPAVTSPLTRAEAIVALAQQPAAIAAAPFLF
jgi:hypothetical protein